MILSWGSSSVWLCQTMPTLPPYHPILSSKVRTQNQFFSFRIVLKNFRSEFPTCAAADPEISKRGGTDRMLYTLLTAHAHTKLHAQCDSAGKRGGHVPLVPYAGSATVVYV